MIHKKLSLDKDYIARSAVPFLLPLAVEPGLNIAQVREKFILYKTVKIFLFI